MLILAIEFFQRGVQVGIDDADDLVLLAGGITLVSLALVLPTVAEALRRPPARGKKAANKPLAIRDPGFV